MEIHASPVGDGREPGITQDVVGEGILAEGEEEKTTPLGERRRGEVERGWHKGAHVEDAECLGVQGGDAVGIGVRDENVVAGRVRDCGVGLLKAALCVGEGALVVSDGFLELMMRGSRGDDGVLPCLESSGSLGITTEGSSGLGSSGLGSGSLGSGGVIVGHGGRGCCSLGCS
ncbi:hypothetical protein GUJ93_ZPchr0066g46488 [Zizania palustris]|uniref:Uncharacterized protein n=1 Tax=Zizania palustris TaxID=103762 RepID=A0A8J5VH72_ZIZPA|nr:hypothetical protein GUJ93_ZPchr0066g46488 [Zizania palustris]